MPSSANYKLTDQTEETTEMQQQVWRPKLTAFLCVSEPLGPPARYLTDMAKGEREEDNFGFVKTAGRAAGLARCLWAGTNQAWGRGVRQASGQRPGLGCTSWAGPEAGASWGRARGATWGPPGPEAVDLLLLSACEGVSLALEQWLLFIVPEKHQ